MISNLAPFIIYSAALFGGMIHPLFLGIFLFINGLWITISGISSSISKSYYFGAGALFFSALCSSFFQPTPVAHTLGIRQLGISLESSFLLGAALLVLGWMLGNPQGERKRLWIFRTYGWLVATTGILALIFQTQRWPFLLS